MSATRAFALRSTLRAACNRPVQSQARIALSRRGYASAASHATHKAGGDLPWLATSAAISIPTLAYLLYSGPEKKSHDAHVAEAHDEHGVAQKKPDEEVGEGEQPKPTSETDAGDAESKGEGEPNDQSKDDGKDDDEKKDDEKSDEGSDKKEEGDKKQSDEKAASQKGSDENASKGKTDSSGKDSKDKSGEMDDSTESQEKKLSDKTSSKRVDPTDK